MKKLLLLALFLCLLTPIFPSFLRAQVIPVWVTSSGSTKDDHGMSIAVDSVGNSYVTGSFFDTIVFGTTVLESNGNSDIFVTKYNPDGKILWAKSYGGSGEDVGYSITCLPGGTLVFTGMISSTVLIGDDTLMGSGGTDVIVSKLTSDGISVWNKSFGGAGEDAGRGVTLDTKGNIYLTGSFSDKITFSDPNATAITAAGATDIFLVKYSTSGDLVWARRAGGISIDEARGICFDKNGFVNIVGIFWGTATFPGGTALDITSGGNYDGFVTQYDLDGAPQWSRRIGGGTDDGANAIAVNDSGTMYITGYYTGTASFGAGTSLTLGGMYLAKYTIDGFSEGAIRVGTNASDVGKSVAVDKSGSVYVIGNFLGKTDFGVSTVPDLTSAGRADIIICCYNATGNLQWANRAGSALSDNGNCVIIDPKNDVLLTGSFSDKVTFPNGTMDEIASLGGFDVYAAKFAFAKSTIVGYTTFNGAPLEGVSVTDGFRVGVSDKTGKYTIQDVTNGSYTVTPSKVGYSFSPASASVVVKFVSIQDVNFIASVALIAPELLSPADKSQNQSTSLSFSWNAAVGAKNYRLQISKSSVFNTLVVDDSMITTTSHVVTILENSTDYYWRVASFDGKQWSQWSAPWSFRTEKEVPGKVSLSTPVNGSVNVPVVTSLIWRTVPSAELYHFQLSTTEDFSTISREDSLLIIVLKTVSNLDISTKYYWRSRAKIGGVWGAWSDTWNFTTSNTVGVDTPENTESLWSITPNPCNDGILTIHGNMTNGVKGHLSLHSMLGATVMDMPVEMSGGTSLSVDIAGLAAGIYRCTIRSGVDVWSQNVVITR